MSIKVSTARDRACGQWGTWMTRLSILNTSASWAAMWSIALAITIHSDVSKAEVRSFRSANEYADYYGRIFVLTERCNSFFFVDQILGRKIRSTIVKRGIDLYGGEYFGEKMDEAAKTKALEVKRDGTRAWCFEMRGAMRQAGEEDLFRQR